MSLESADIQFPTFASFAFLQSLTQLILAVPPRRASSSLGLLFPTAQVRIEGLLVRQGSTPVYVPPSGFGYPLDGLLPSIPSEFCFTLTALMGCSPSKLYLLTRYRDVPITVNPPAVSLTFYTRIEIRVRRREPRLLGLNPCGKPKSSSRPKPALTW